MIDFLSGKIARLEPLYIVLEVSGIGYGIHIPLNAPGLENVSTGDFITLFTRVIYREDSQEIYGFPEKTERDLFEFLISLSGIGPRQSLNMISTLGFSELLAAIEKGNGDLLLKVPGIGKQKVEKILFETRNRKDFLSLNRTSNVQTQSIVPQDAYSALISLGFREKEIESVENKLQKQGLQFPEKDAIQEWIRLFLKNM